MPPKATHQFICQAWGQDCTSLPTVYKFYSKYSKSSNVCFDDEMKTGRPHTSRTPETVLHIRRLISSDPYLTTEQISRECGISVGTTYTILKRDLQMRSICAKPVPHLLTDIQKLNRVQSARCLLEVIASEHSISRRLVVIDEKWVYHRASGCKRSNRAWVSPGGDRPHVVKKSQFDLKTMVLVAVSFDGKCFVETLAPGCCVNGERYIQFLQAMHQDFANKGHKSVG